MRNRTPAALTLIELMAALAIASLLMAATLSTVGSLLRARALGEGALDRSPQSAPWRAVLFRDLFNATQYTPGKTGFTLQTHAWLDSGTLNAACLDSTVTYEVRQINERNWLTRTQRSQFGGDFEDLVYPGVESIRLTATEAVPPSGRKANDLQNMADAMEVTMKFDAEGMEPVTVSFRRE